jgi:hypothetical protein
MRTFELSLWLAGVCWSVWRLAGCVSRRSNAAFLVLTAIGAVLHTAFEGARFHMVPTYVVIAALVALTGRDPAVPRRRRLWLVIPSTALFFLAAIALPAAFPVFDYEAPTGAYGIGTKTYAFDGGPGDRAIVVQAWYPVARGTPGRRVGITPHPEILQTAYASFTGLPSPLFDHLRLVRTHAIEGAALPGDGSSFPVVLFSHGPLSGNRSQSLFQMEALASHGFVAVAIDHTGYASTTIFPDGHAIGPLPEATWPVFVDERSSAMVRTWVDDVRFVIDRLAGLNADDPERIMTGRLNLSKIGYLGASFGGSVVVDALLKEPRIKAGLAQDGKAYFFDETLTNLRRPLMYMQSAEPYIASTDAQLARWGVNAASFKLAEQDHYARQMQLFARSNGPVYNVFIRGTNHITFSDLFLALRMPSLHLMSTPRAHRIINAYTIAFFERYLEGRMNALVDGRSPGPYPEATVAVRNVVDDVPEVAAGPAKDYLPTRWGGSRLFSLHTYSSISDAGSSWNTSVAAQARSYALGSSIVISTTR